MEPPPRRPQEFPGRTQCGYSGALSRLYKPAARLRRLPGGLAHTERVSKEILYLPVYPELSDMQAEIVSKAVLTFGQVTSKDKGA